MTARQDGREPDPGLFADAGAASALDLLLSDAALGVVRRFAPSASTLRFALGLARRPRAVAQRGASLASEVASIVAGRSAIAPGRKDRRSPTPRGRPIRRWPEPFRPTWPGRARSSRCSPTRNWTGATPSGCGSCSATSSPPPRPATTR